MHSDFSLATAVMRGHVIVSTISLHFRSTQRRITWLSVLLLNVPLFC